MAKLCNNCGNQIKDEAKFCPICGAADVPAPQQNTPPEQKKEEKQDPVNHSYYCSASACNRGSGYTAV